MTLAIDLASSGHPSSVTSKYTAHGNSFSKMQYGKIRIALSSIKVIIHCKTSLEMSHIMTS